MWRSACRCPWQSLFSIQAVPFPCACAGFLPIRLSVWLQPPRALCAFPLQSVRTEVFLPQPALKLQTMAALLSSRPPYSQAAQTAPIRSSAQTSPPERQRPAPGRSPVPCSDSKKSPYGYSFQKMKALHEKNPYSAFDFVWPKGLIPCFA